MGLNAQSSAYIYVEDSKVISENNNENDVAHIQKDMENYYEWAENNFMNFNSLKFVVLRYGSNEEIKLNTIYFSDNMESIIESQDNHRDLGVSMSANGSFDDHINNVINKIKRKIGWVCRTFRCRNLEFMRHIYITIIRPHLDYCSQLWGPDEGPSLDRLEKVQAFFTRLIPEIRNLPYDVRIRILRISSVQRRFDRYRIFYVRKILIGKVPDVGLKIRTKENHRIGLTLENPANKKSSKLFLGSFLVRGPETFNALPKDLRKLGDSMDTFKIKLDNFLSLIPDCPRICGGSLYQSNKLDIQIRNWKWNLGC